MAVPITFQGEKLGVLEVVNKTGKAHYTEEDLTILETLASQAAIAIQNAALLNEVRKSQEQMVRLDLMKSDFIAITSHELRTPLGLILGHATFLREVIQPDYQAQMDTIVRNAMRLKEIIDSISNMDNARTWYRQFAYSPVLHQAYCRRCDGFIRTRGMEKKSITVRADLGQG